MALHEEWFKLHFLIKKSFPKEVDAQIENQLSELNRLIFTNEKTELAVIPAKSDSHKEEQTTACTGNNTYILRHQIAIIAGLKNLNRSIYESSSIQNKTEIYIAIRAFHSKLTNNNLYNYSPISFAFFPESTLINIFGHLPPEDLVNVSRVSNRLSAITNTPLLWEKLAVSRLPRIAGIRNLNFKNYFINWYKERYKYWTYVKPSIRRLFSLVFNNDLDGLKAQQKLITVESSYELDVDRKSYLVIAKEKGYQAIVAFIQTSAKGSATSEYSKLKLAVVLDEYNEEYKKKLDAMWQGIAEIFKITSRRGEPRYIREISQWSTAQIEQALEIMFSNHDEAAIETVIGPHWHDEKMAALAIGKAAFMAFKHGNKDLGDKLLDRSHQVKYYVVLFAWLEGNAGLFQTFYDPKNLAGILYTSLDIDDAQCVDYFVKQSITDQQAIPNRVFFYALKSGNLPLIKLVLSTVELITESSFSCDTNPALEKFLTLTHQLSEDEAYKAIEFFIKHNNSRHFLLCGLIASSNHTLAGRLLKDISRNTNAQRPVELLNYIISVISSLSNHRGIISITCPTKEDEAKALKLFTVYQHFNKCIESIRLGHRNFNKHLEEAMQIDPAFTEILVKSALTHSEHDLYSKKKLSDCVAKVASLTQHNADGPSIRHVLH